VSKPVVYKGSTAHKKLYNDLRNELRSLAETGLPHVSFLLQHDYTQSGLCAEVRTGSEKE
jgi:hypothetical protein